MDDFETFKASREQMDPTSRKMSDHQWKQAYAAYRSARERLGGSESSEGQGEGHNGQGKGKRRRNSKTKASARGMHRPSSVSEIGLLRQKVRAQSAYSDLRLIVDIMAWVAVAILVLTVVVSVFYYTSVAVALISLLGSGVQIVGILVARLLVPVLIDIPDIALYRSLQEAEARSARISD
jgi:hypothetical protein